MDLSGDHHVHTSLCNHARGEMEEYVQSAVLRGLSCITFLEHLECGIIYSHRTWLEQKHFTEYFREGKRLQKLYAGRITIRLGVETGYNPAALDQLRDMISCFPFDHIGVSYHYYFDGSRHRNMVSRRSENIKALIAAGTDHVLDEYFNGLIRACSELPCDKICHLDAVLRHVPGIRFKKRHYNLITKLLTTMAGKNIGLEVNTAGISLRSQPYPAENIVRQAQGLGIPLLAGSDAHRPDQVGRYFAQLSSLYR